MEVLFLKHMGKRGCSWSDNVKIPTKIWVRESELNLCVLEDGKLAGSSEHGKLVDTQK